ncbi:MAG: serine/threonine protein kinase, partial [Planctomycetes bacterium]|nr:serine/threonine protein kinase [Planctomycetota bacterium]
MGKTDPQHEEDLKYYCIELYDKTFESEASSEEEPFIDEFRGERYVEMGPLGTGGMKNVSLVFDLFANREVAMARPKSDLPSREMEAFLREARLNAILQHPNILPVHDIGLDQDNRPYFTMELKRGHTMEKAINDEVLGRREGLEVLIKCCDALCYAHSKGVLHLDIKPANIYIGQHGEVLLGDWGLGKVHGTPLFEDNPSLFNPDMLGGQTLTGQVKGTPGYMAPEQTNTMKNKTPLTDVYGLGATLFAHLTGIAPPVLELGSTHKNKPNNPPSPQLLFPEKIIPDSLNAVCMKAMAIDPKERYLGVEQMSKDLKNYLDGYSTLAEEATVLRKVGLLLRRNRWSALATTLVLLTSLVLLWLYILQIKEKQRHAETLHDKVTHSFSLYKKEKEKNHNLATQSQEVLTEQIYQLSDNKAFDDIDASLKMALQQLDLLKEVEGDQEFAKMQSAYIHFMRQDLQAVRELYPNKGPHGIFDLIEFAQKTPPHEGKLLPTRHIIDYIKNQKKPFFRKKFIVLIMLYDGIHRKDKTKHALLLREVIKFFNPNWNEANFAYQSKTQSLRLWGEGLSVLSIKAKYLKSRGG